MLTFRPKKGDDNKLSSIYEKNNNNTTYVYNNGTIIPNYYNIEDVREMLIIHVVRTRQVIKTNNLFEPLSINTPPSNVNSNIEYFNDTVEYGDDISDITNIKRTFTLKSVIC
jgi:hypothetical protein